MHINELKIENFVKERGKWKGNWSNWNRVQVLFIYIGECTGHVLAWPGQFSLAAIGILGKYTAWRCVRLVLHSLLVRNTASIPHLLLHTSGNQYRVALEPPNSYLCHHAWGFQPLPLRAKWCVISSAVWSFGQLLSCRINVLRRKNSWENTPNQTVVFKWSTSGILIMLVSCCIQRVRKPSDLTYLNLIHNKHLVYSTIHLTTWFCCHSYNIKTLSQSDLHQCSSRIANYSSQLNHPRVIVMLI